MHQVLAHICYVIFFLLLGAAGGAYLQKKAILKTVEDDIIAGEHKVSQSLHDWWTNLKHKL